MQPEKIDRYDKKGTADNQIIITAAAWTEQESSSEVKQRGRTV